MKKTPFLYRSLFLLFLLPFINTSIAQLTIDAGTKWISSNDTYTVLDNTGIQYNAAPSLLQNVFRFTGTGNVSINGSSQPGFNTIVIAKSGAGKILLGRDIDVLQSVRFQTGLFDLNGNNVFLHAAALIQNESESSRFIGAGGGTIQIPATIISDAPVNPGNIGAEFSLAGSLGDVTIKRGHQPQEIKSGANSINRYYDIVPGRDAEVNATLRFHYFDAELNSLPENSLVMWNQSGSAWNNLSYTTRDTSLNYVEKTNVPLSSRITLAEPDNVLAVQGMQLSGVWKRNMALLTWVTLTETNNLYFDIERKYPQENNYTKIASVASKHADGNSQSATTYAYNDATATPGAPEILYRLKQVNKNGQIAYSNTTLVKPSALQEFIHAIYPTIVTGNRIFIQAGNMDITTMQVQLFDMQGKRLLNQSLPYQSQWLLLPFMSKGMYQLSIQSGEWKYSRSVIR